MTLDQETLTRLAADLADISEHITKLTEEADAIKARIRDGVDGPDTYAAGNLSIIVAPNRRFNDDKALKAIPAELLPLVTTQQVVVDRKKLEVLAPEAYEAGWINYADRVSVK